MATESKLVSLVEEGQQAVVICLLAKNENNAPIIDSQLDLAINMAKNVLQMAGCEVAASGSAIRFDPVNVGGVARLTATLDTIIEGTASTAETSDAQAAEETTPETAEEETELEVLDENDGTTDGADE